MGKNGDNLIMVLESLIEDISEWSAFQEKPWIYKAVADELEKVVEKFKLNLRGEEEPF